MIVMMLVTKVLKKTTGEDNKKTEMYAFIKFQLSCIVHVFVLILVKVHDGKPNSPNWPHGVGRHIGWFVFLQSILLEPDQLLPSPGYGPLLCSAPPSPAIITVFPGRSGLLPVVAQ